MYFVKILYRKYFVKYESNTPPINCNALCCSALQCVAVWCSVLQCVAVDTLKQRRTPSHSNLTKSARRCYTLTNVKKTLSKLKETLNMSKETLNLWKETLNMSKETSQRDALFHTSAWRLYVLYIPTQPKWVSKQVKKTRNIWKKTKEKTPTLNARSHAELIPSHWTHSLTPNPLPHVEPTPTHWTHFRTLNLHPHTKPTPLHWPHSLTLDLIPHTQTRRCLRTIYSDAAEMRAKIIPKRHEAFGKRQRHERRDTASHSRRSLTLNPLSHTFTHSFTTARTSSLCRHPFPLNPFSYNEHTPSQLEALPHSALTFWHCDLRMSAQRLYTSTQPK